MHTEDSDVINAKFEITTKEGTLDYAIEKYQKFLDEEVVKGVIGGCIGTSNVLCGQLFDVPVKGTHAHS